MTYSEHFIGVMKGLRLVIRASIELRKWKTDLTLTNSSMKPFLSKYVTDSKVNCSEVDIKDMIDRAYVIAEGLKQFAMLRVSSINDYKKHKEIDRIFKKELDELENEFDEAIQSHNSSRNGINNSKPLPGDNYKLSFKKPILENIETSKLKHQSKNQFLKNKTTQQSMSKPALKKKIEVSLSEDSKERAVPATRLARLMSFGTLAAELGVGVAGQYARNTFYTITKRENPEEKNLTNPLLSPAISEKIVNTLCKVRGAALKLGQLLSFQDESVLSPELQLIFERVRKSADFMPQWQMHKVMSTQFGAEWRSHLKHFTDKPFAAASIGQVHRGILHDGREVAIKIQYPGVAKGIHSDIDNLMAVLKVWDLFPKGLFIDNIVEVAKKELTWEVDYEREAYFTKKFKAILSPYPEYYVPDVIENLCTKEVITTELVYGLPVENLTNAPEQVRKDVAAKVMKLCLIEMFLLRCMQTDPNWANFLYDDETGKLILIDFGATREYSKEFMDKYIDLVHAASEGNRKAVLDMSREMKFLTGYESKIMENAHVDTVMIMGEVFTKNAEFDFGRQSSTRRIAALVPTVLQHRLCAPPDEVYSLHRKMSGVFLLCSKLKVSLDCHSIFQDVYHQYKS